MPKRKKYGASRNSKAGFTRSDIMATSAKKSRRKIRGGVVRAAGAVRMAGAGRAIGAAGKAVSRLKVGRIKESLSLYDYRKNSNVQTKGQSRGSFSQGKMNRAAAMSEAPQHSKKLAKMRSSISKTAKNKGALRRKAATFKRKSARIKRRGLMGRRK